MKKNLFVYSTCFLLCFADWPPISFGCPYQTCSQAGGREINAETKELPELDNDFESGTLQPWIDESQGSVRWKVENQQSPWEANNPAPQPSSGKSYLRIDRGGSPYFSVATLRSPTFQLTSSEYYISFSFWIRSKWPAFTNLELYLAENGNEVPLVNLYNYSDISNRAWQSHSVLFRGRSTMDFSLVFYAYCGIDAEDAVAIDDIRISPFQESTTSSVSEFTSTSSVTTLTTTEVIECSAKLGTIPGSSFHCPDNREMLYPVPDDPCSTQYYECSNCIATKKDCVGNKIFNSERQDCQPCILVKECADACND